MTTPVPTPSAPKADPVEKTAPPAVEAVEPVEITPPAASNWWQFTDQGAAETWANNLVTNRLTRVQKTKIDPLEETRATLEAEVQRLKPFEEASLSEGERRDAREAATAQELAELRGFKAQTARTETIRTICDEIGLPIAFATRLVGDDEAAIREDAQTLLNTLSEGGSNAKKTPPAKTPKTDQPAGGSVQPGGGGGDDESDDALTQSIIADIEKARARGGLSVRH